jgi:replicative DNA helicase
MLLDKSIDRIDESRYARPDIRENDSLFTMKMGTQVGIQLIQSATKSGEPRGPLLLPSLDPGVQSIDEMTNMVVLRDYVVISGRHGVFITTAECDDLVRLTEIALSS